MATLNIDPDLLELFLEFEGTNGSTTFTDSSTNNLPVVAHSGATISTAEFDCGNSSLIVDPTIGSAPHGASVAYNAALNFGTSDFFIVVKFFAVIDAGDYTSRGPFRYHVSGSSTTLGMRWHGVVNQTVRWYYGDNWAGNVYDSATAITAGGWHEMMIQRRNGFWEFFLDGVPDHRTAVEGGGGFDQFTATVDLGASGIYVGRAFTGANAWDGYLDEVMIGRESFDVWSTGYDPACFTVYVPPQATGPASAPSPMGAPALLGRSLFGAARAASPLSAARALATHDFTVALSSDAATRFVMDLITQSGVVRAPISSWQATLQSGSSSYVQCVVPACLELVDAINAATEFIIYRRADIPGSALSIEYEMARSAAELAQFSRGPDRFTCVLSGYPPEFAASINPPAAYDRQLTGVRSVSTSGALRVRCAIDWLLRPGHRAYVDATPLVVRYINYYALAGDAYMDVGE